MAAGERFRWMHPRGGNYLTASEQKHCYEPWGLKEGGRSRARSGKVVSQRWENVFSQGPLPSWGLLGISCRYTWVSQAQDRVGAPPPSQSLIASLPENCNEGINTRFKNQQKSIWKVRNKKQFKNFYKKTACLDTKLVNVQKTLPVSPDRNYLHLCWAKIFKLTVAFQTWKLLRR